MTTTAYHFVNAVRAIAEENASYHVASAITPRDVERHLDADVLSAWIRREVDLTSPEDLVERALDNMTTAQCAALLAVPAIRAALRPLCIADLALEAEEMQETESSLDRDPGDLSDARYERERQDRVDAEVGP